MTPACLASLPECRVAASKDAKIRRVFREPSGDLDLRQWPQQRKIADARRNRPFDISSEITLEFEGLAILVINLDPIEAEVCGAGGMLVRHRYSIAPGQHGAGERNGAQNAGYRNVAVQRTGLVELQQACVQPAMNPDEGQLRGPNAGSNRFGVTQREEQHRFAPLPETFDRDDRILAAADRYTRPSRELDSYR